MIKFPKHDKLFIIWSNKNLLETFIFYLSDTILKPTETSKKVKFMRKKIKLQRKYINHCVVFEIYCNFIIKQQ